MWEAPQAIPPKPYKRPYVFIAVGVFNTILDFSFYTLLTQTIFKDQDQLALAGFVSGTLALVSAFLTHNFITWKERPASHTTVIKFFAFTGFGMWVLRPLLLGMFIHLKSVYDIVYQLSEALNLPFGYDFIAKTGAFGFMVIVVLVYNYSVYDRFVFPNKLKHGDKNAS